MAGAGWPFFRHIFTHRSGAYRFDRADKETGSPGIFSPAG